MRVIFLVLSLVYNSLSIEHDFKGFDDSIIFGINWPGSPELNENLVDSENKSQNQELIKVTTTNKESYECHLPELRNKQSSNIDDYDGPSPLHLLKPLMSKEMCSYRLESYWSYEVCHGRYIRQYHEERDGKEIKTQEFYLGYWSSEKQAKLETDMKVAQESKLQPKTTKVEGVALPNVELVMDGGTICDLNGKPRLTRLHYVCYSHGKHEVYSFRETSTCEYEIIILSPFLCEHPQFKPVDVGENIINCLPMGDAPRKPRELLKMEAKRLKLHHQSVRLMDHADQTAKDILAVLKVGKFEKDGETHLKFELHPLGDDEEGGKDKHSLVNTDDSPVRAFLRGENCLTGGTGWWKYEFCYGKHVLQYHIDRTGEKTTVMLGRFDEQAHLDWIKVNKWKAPKPIDQRISISHFYSNGDMCDKTGKPRQTEIKLKCLENSSSPAQVSLYLIEPKTCHYILGVESPLICEILPLADENGLVEIKEALEKSKDKYDNVDDVFHKNLLNYGND